MKKIYLLITLLVTSFAEIDSSVAACVQDSDCSFSEICWTLSRSEGGGNVCRDKLTVPEKSFKSTNDLSFGELDKRCITDRDCKTGSSCRSISGGGGVCKSALQETVSNTNQAKPIEKKLEEEQKAENARPKKVPEDDVITAKADDATCKSYGAKFGSPAYVQCRIQLSSQRAEALERQKNIDFFEAKIEVLQRQLNSQQSTSTNNKAFQDETRDIAIQQEQMEVQKEQLRLLKAQNERAKAEAAQRYLDWANNPQTWGNPVTVKIVT